ncbi:Mce-associated membrane protein [Nocardioides luteus]|uniref:Mce-associated membrane protein n=1 Tax=Nocardioides luteus TaxID=1844 RepID=A0ABQ5SXX9_9ACTN|nr:hypothetical protein [Nocardioides luteus]MDR7312443.1 Mce-associated membrane protein [Nocardioides luteus]GGR58510.1 hypothetical protein GCM10010197_26690 [Nocardioides luteus]GLJ68691.1 hypothetical protein GCM10017579_27270 [Nocardioides luteus]
MSAATSLSRRGILILTAVILVLALGAFFMADRERRTDHVGNRAVVDSEATTEVQSAVTAGLLQVFSYDFSDPAPTQAAADEFLAGDARKEYDLLFKQLEKKAPGQKLVLSAEVQVAAVKSLDADSAELLVFLDQASQRSTDKESSISAAQLAVEADKVDGTWMVTSLDLF